MNKKLRFSIQIISRLLNLLLICSYSLYRTKYAQMCVQTTQTYDNHRFALFCYMHFKHTEKETHVCIIGFNSVSMYELVEPRHTFVNVLFDASSSWIVVSVINGWSCSTTVNMNYTFSKLWYHSMRYIFFPRSRSFLW